MEMDEIDIIKQRQIAFESLHPDPNQAQTAALLLSDVNGILDAEDRSPTLLNLRYNVLEISLEQIEGALSDSGFHLSSKLLDKLRRALYYYKEETQRANSGCPRGGSNCTRKVFINRYHRRDHSLKDPRPEHWRKYL